MVIHKRNEIPIWISIFVLLDSKYDQHDLYVHMQVSKIETSCDTTRKIH